MVAKKSKLQHGGKHRSITRAKKTRKRRRRNKITNIKYGGGKLKWTPKNPEIKPEYNKIKTCVKKHTNDKKKVTKFFTRPVKAFAKLQDIRREFKKCDLYKELQRRIKPEVTDDEINMTAVTAAKESIRVDCLTHNMCPTRLGQVKQHVKGIIPEYEDLGKRARTAVHKATGIDSSQNKKNIARQVMSQGMQAAATHLPQMAQKLTGKNLSPQQRMALAALSKSKTIRKLSLQGVSKELGIKGIKGGRRTKRRFKPHSKKRSRKIKRSKCIRKRRLRKEKRSFKK